MRLVTAFYAFFKALLHTDCAHERINRNQSGSYCPDCGYQVHVTWTMLRCRKCTAKRLPRKDLDGSVVPMYHFCQHCGTHDTQIVKKVNINPHEMPYAILTKDVDYLNDTIRPVERPHNPFEVLSKEAKVFDGEVVKKHTIAEA